MRLNYENYITWKLDNNSLLIGFEFFHCQKLILLTADPKDLLYFKTLVQGKILFKKIGDFYEPQVVIGKGGSAKVYILLFCYFEVIEVLSKFDNIKYAAKIIEK